MSRSVDCFNICLIASLHYPACSAADLAALQCNCAHCVSSAYYTIQKPIIMPDFARLMQSVFNITEVRYHKSRNSISLYFLLFYMWKKPNKQNTRCENIQFELMSQASLEIYQLGYFNKTLFSSIINHKTSFSTVNIFVLQHRTFYFFILSFPPRLDCCRSGIESFYSCTHCLLTDVLLSIKN